VEHRIEAGDELRIAVADQRLQRVHPGAQLRGEVAGLLGDPRAGRVGGRPADVQPAGLVLDEDQRIDPSQQDGVDGQEVAGDDPVALGGQELLPRRARTSRRRVDASPGQDLPHRRGRDPVSGAG
jgi:hypothetical protein